MEEEPVSFVKQYTFIPTLKHFLQDPSDTGRNALDKHWAKEITVSSVVMPFKFGREVPAFQRNLLPSIWSRIDKAGSPEKCLPMHHTTGRHIPEESNLYCHRREDVKSHIKSTLSWESKNKVPKD
jgi:hypothetical protein